MPQKRTRDANAALDKTIEQIYQAHCSGMQLSIMRIPEMFAQARVLLRAGRPHDDIGRWMVEFVQQDKL